MHVASHDLFNMKLRTCLDTGYVSIQYAKVTSKGLETRI